MKIISKVKDYYDYLGQIYGVDTALVYKRDPKEIDISCGLQNTSFHNIPNKELTRIQVDFMILWFCETPYPLIQVIKEKSDVGSHVVMYREEARFYYYDYESFIKDWSFVDEGVNSYTVERKKEHFSKVKKISLDKFGKSPQVLQFSGKLHTDIILKDYQFSKVMSPEQAFQRVSMYLGAKQDPPQTVPTEMHRFEAKGFDKKTSFRRPKEDKK